MKGPRDHRLDCSWPRGPAACCGGPSAGPEMLLGFQIPCCLVLSHTKQTEMRVIISDLRTHFIPPLYHGKAEWRRPWREAPMNDC